MKELCLTLYQFLCTGGCFSGAIPHRSSGRSGAGDRHPDRSCGAAVLRGGPADRFRPGTGRAVRQERRACGPQPVRPVESGRDRHHDVVRGGSSPPRQPHHRAGHPKPVGAPRASQGALRLPPNRPPVEQEAATATVGEFRSGSFLNILQLFFFQTVDFQLSTG